MAECTIYDKLRYIAETKDLIKAAIEAQDVEVLESATFRQYAEYITQIRKVSSVNGMQGDVTITAEGLGALTEIPSEYITETELNEKGYLTAIPDVYITEDELSSQLADKVSQNGLNEAIEGVRNDIPTNVSELTNDSGYITLNEVPKVDLSGYALKSEIPDISFKQDKLTAGNGISITDNVISLDYEYDLFEVVQSLPTENISDNKVYLLLDSNGSEGNTYVEYLYVNGQWEELGKFKVNIDLSGYATEDWVNSQGFLKEHQDISNLATKSELATKQDTISDLETIRSGASKGATALQSVPSEYATEQWVNEQGFLKEHQDISNLATKSELATKQDVISDLDTIRSGAALGATALQEVPSTYAKKTDILTAKTDTRYTTYDVQNPVLSGKTIILQNEVTDSRKYHTFGYEKTYSTTSSNALLNGSTPLYRDSNEYNCPQWDGYSIRFTYQSGNEVYTTLTIPYTYNGIKYVTHLCINVYNDSVRMLAYPYSDDENFPDYQIVTFKDSEIYNSHRSYGTLCIYINGEMQNYDSEPYSPDFFDAYVMPGQEVEIRVLNFPLTTPNGALIIETPRFYLSSNNVLIGDVPTEEETSNAPERLNDYIRYANNVKAYILTDKNTTFKTINGQQITGDGDITIDTNVDLSGYATKSELNTKQDVISDLDSIRSGAALGATALQSVPSEYVTETELNNKGYLTSVPDTYATEQWVNEQGFLKEHQDISNLATKAELATKQDVINDLDTIRSGAAKGATALQSVPDTYALKTDILSAKTDTRYTDYEVQNPVLSGNTIVLQNEVTDSRKYHTLGFDKTAETTEIGQVIKYSRFNREFDSIGNPIIDTNFDNNQNIPLDFSHITDDGDQIIIHYTGSFANNDYETGTSTEGDSFEATITYNRNTKQLNASDDGDITIYHFTRSDTGEYIFDPRNKHFDCWMLPDGAYLIWNIGSMSSNLYYRYNVSTQGNLFVGEITTTSPTSRLPHNKNEFFRYENDVKAYILTDKNTTFKTINGQQITGNGNIEISTDVDLSNLATKEELNTKQDAINDLETIRSGAAKGATALQSVPSGYATEQWVNEQGFLKEHQDISNLATKEELSTKQNVITDLDSIRSGAALGATALQEVPSEYVTETELNNKGYLTSVPDTYALKSEIPDISTKQDTLVSGTNIKTINGTSLLGSGDITIEGGSGSVDLTDYYTKSETNELVNPKISQVTLTQAEYDALQTKEENVLYIISDAEDLKFKTINGKQILGEGNIEIKASADNVPTLQTTPEGTASNYIYSSGKDDKYGVISDITTHISYSSDHASISSAQYYWGSKSKNAYDIWSIDAATTSKAGLMSASDKTKLDGIDITTKQDTLVSGTNIKTVNGISLLGEGNITVSGEGGADLSGYYTKAEIDEMIGGASNTITEINNLVG